MQDGKAINTSKHILAELLTVYLEYCFSFVFSSRGDVFSLVACIVFAYAVVIS